MLVLTVRKNGNLIITVDGKEIRLMNLSPHRVKLGIRAPREVAAIREEARKVAV